MAIFSDSVFAFVYYLDPVNGKDGNSTSAAQNPTTPWKTMAKVKSTVAAGDTVNIIGGTYTPSQYKGESGLPVWQEFHSHGEPNKVITIQARPGDTVVFDGQQESYWMLFREFGDTKGFYVVIQNITFRNYYAAVISLGSGPNHSSRLAVLNCTFQDIGTGQGAPLAVGQSASHAIFKGNTIKNSGDPSLPSDGFPAAQHGIYITEGNSNTVLDQNYIEKISGLGIHYWGHDHYNLTTTQSIIRRNTIVNAHEAGLIIAGTNYQNTYVYNNTFYQEQVPFPQLNNRSASYFVTFHNGLNSKNMKVLNNLGYGYVAPAPVEADTDSNFNGTLTLNYNLWQNLTGSNNLYLWNYAAGTYYTLTSFRATYGYEMQTQQMQQTTAPFIKVAERDFTLPSTSPAIDAGTFLTTTVGAGSGTTLTVADAGFFMDGFGLIAGDMIQVGSQSPVQITAINYGTNAITVAQSISWSAGQGVSLPYSGNKPDIGAYEYKTDGNITLPAPSNLRVN
jgi:hypothetical protein